MLRRLIRLGFCTGIILAGLALGQRLSAGPTLRASDLVVVDFQQDSLDRIVLLALAPIPANSVIFLTDAQWLANGDLSSNGLGTAEFLFQWTTPNSIVPAGTLVTFTFPAPSATVTTGSLQILNGTSLEPLSPAGDQLAIFQTFNDASSMLLTNIKRLSSSGQVESGPIYTFNIDSPVNSPSFNATNGGTSANGFGTKGGAVSGVTSTGTFTPPDSVVFDNTTDANRSTANAFGLGGFFTATATTDWDNVRYNGPTTAATKEGWLIRIHSVSNWVGTETAPWSDGQGTLSSGGSVEVGVAGSTITSATYNATTGVLTVAGTNFTTAAIDETKLTLTGEGGATCTLTETGSITASSTTQFSVTLNATDKAAVNQLLNKNGTVSTGGTTYNLAAAANWTGTASTDATGNTITVSSVPAPTISSATYDASTGVLAVTGTGFLKRVGATNDINVAKLTLVGDLATSRALTTSNVEITSDTSFSVTLNAADRAELSVRLNKDGTSSNGGTSYNLAAAEDWAVGADAAVNVADLTGNGVTVSGVGSGLRLLFTEADADYSQQSAAKTLGGRVFKASDDGGGNLLAFDDLGLYALSEASSNNGTKLTISIESGYSFDVTGLLAKVTGTSFSVALTYVDNSTTSFNVTGLTSNEATIVSSFSTALNDVKQVVLTTTDYGVFNNFAIEDIKLSVSNAAPAFVGATTALDVNQNAGATSLKDLLHASDADSGQTLTWSQNTAPSHGTLSFSNATASSGSTDITPGGTITYTPTAGYTGSDSFVVKVSDGMASATRTISVTVNAVSTAPTLASSTPAHNSTGVALDGTITLTFDQPIYASPGRNVTIVNVANANDKRTVALESPMTVFISEYVEGSADTGIGVQNDAIELYNPHNVPVVLGPDPVVIQIYRDATSNFGQQSLTLDQRTIPARSTFTFINNQGTPALLAIPGKKMEWASLQHTSGGNDIFVVRLGVVSGQWDTSGRVLDAVGQLGVNPGVAGWGSGEVTTSNHTLRRKKHIYKARSDATAPFDPTIEWDSYPADTISGLGSHEFELPAGSTTYTIKLPSNLLVGAQYSVQFPADAFSNAGGAFVPALTAGQLTFTTNTAPAISDVANQTTTVGVATSALAVTVGDSETSAAALQLTGSSSNTTLIPDSNLVFGGSGANRTVTITPAAGQTGSATITLTVTDAIGATATDTFTVTVAAGDTTPPRIASITRQNPATATTTATSVTWRITFDEEVSGAGTADFATTGTPTGTLAVNEVSSVAYDVTLSGITGTGTVTLGFASGFTIKDGAGNTLADTTPAGTNDNTFTIAPLDVAPLIVSVVRQSPTTTETTATSVTWRFTFNETVTGVAAADFVAEGTPTGTLSVNAVSGSVYDVTLSSITGEGAIRIGFASGFAISDTGSNALTNTAPTTTLENEYLRTNPIIAPSIVSHPESKTVAGLLGTTLTVSASGTEPLSYQWFKDDKELDGQIFPTLEIPQVVAANGGAYKVKVTNPAGNITSSPATLSVAPYILNSSPGRSVGLGGKHTFFVSAEGSGTLTYQWRKDGKDIEGATHATYEINPVAVAHAGEYDVLVGHSVGSTTTDSTGALLTVLPNPQVYLATSSIANASGITAYVSIEGTQPKTLVIAAYGPALTSTPGAISDPQLVVEDASGANIVSNDNWGTNTADKFAGTYARLGLTSLVSDSKDAVVYATLNAGSYRIRISGVGGATGVVQLAIADADYNPASRLAYVAVRGPVAAGAPLNGGFNIVNSADKKILLRAIGPSLGAGGLADPSVTVFDGSSSVTSNNDWAGDSTLAGAFTQAGAFALANDSKDAALLAAMRIGTGSYTAQVTSASGSGDVLWEAYDLVGSTPASFAPIIVVAPVAQSASGGNVTFNVIAVGGGTLGYKWKKGTTLIEGASTATLTLNNVSSADAADYAVEVSNAAGTASASASLHHIPSISSITGPVAASYKAGATLSFAVAVNGNVTVTGTPRIALTLGASTVHATYAPSASSATSLVFHYTIAAGDTDTDGIVSASAIDLNGGTIKDSANNDIGLTFTAPALTGVLVDTTAPTVALTSTATGPTNSSAIPLTIAFSESVTGFAAADLTVSGATAGALSGSGKTYSVTLTPTGDGTITVNLAAGQAEDAAGNGNAAAAQFSIVCDRTSPAAPVIVATDEDTGVSSTDAITRDDQLVFRGTAEAGSTIALRWVGGPLTVGTGTADSSGNWSVDFTAVTIGSFSIPVPFVATATDAAGNLSASSATFQVRVDRVAPTVTLTSTAGSLTRTSPIPLSITFSETVHDFTVDDLVVSGGVAGNLSGSGASFTTAITPAGDGPITVTLAAGKAQDTAGNENTAATPFSINYDGTAPAAPVIASISTDSGASATDGITNDTTLTLAGAAEANSVVELFRGTLSLGTVTAGASGAWTFDYAATTLTDAAYAFSATAKDAAGNASVASAPFNVTIDTAAPAAPAITAISDDTGDLPSDRITKDTTLVISGTAEPGSTVTLTRVGNSLLGTAAADAATGAWSYDYTGTMLGAGEHSFTATTTDAAGNTSAVSAALIVTVDTAVATPVIASFSTNSGAATDAITNDNTLVLAGTAEPNSTVTLTRSGAAGPLGTATADSSGAWTFDYTTTTLADGSYLFNASAVDLAGNPSATSADFPVTIDTAAPAAPAIASITSDSGSSTTDRVTSDTTLTFAGTAEAGAAIAITRTGVGVVGNVNADTTGAWTFDYTATALTDGVHAFTATATDSAANTSAASPDFAVTIDTAAPVVTSAVTADANYKAAFTFTVAASGAPTSFGATGLPAGLVLDSATGIISGAPTETGPFTVALTATDAAGNVGAGSLTITVAKINLTVAGITATDRVYDATTIASLNLGTAKLVGIIGTDTVTLNAAGAVGAFADKTIGAAKPVAISGLVIEGTHAVHYTLTQPVTTASITAKSLTVAGITANDKAYDGSQSARLNLGGAALVGVIGADAVTLSTSDAIGTFAGSSVGLGRVVAISGLAIGGSDAGNYTLTAPIASASILAAPVGIMISNLEHVYDGTAKQATITASPTVPLQISYSGTPINAGSYTVNVSVADGNYAGSRSATLTIAKAGQTVSINAPATGSLGAALPVSASASSGLPVTISIVSGGASLSGGSVTFNVPGAVTLRAEQAGNENYAAASAEATVTVAGKLAQTIAFGAPGDRLSNSGSFTLNATATSGLPVSFAILGGPAMLSGNTVTLTGAAGRVLVRASQAGNAIYDAAPDVDVGFTITAATLNVFFGAVMDPTGTNRTGDVAATLPPNSNQGSLLVVAPGAGVNTVLDFTLNSDGTFTQTVIVDVQSGTGVSPVVSSATAVPAVIMGETPMPARGAAPVTLTLRGTLINGVLRGVIEPLGLAFSANVLPVAGPSANAAGFYKSSTLANTSGATYSVVGTNNEVLVLAHTPEVTTGGMTTLQADGTFGLQTQTTAGTATIRGTVDEPTTTVAGTISLPGKPDTSFAGLVVTTTRTDRLINLSSRVRIGAGDRVLITGFVIGGSESKQVLIRGIGPALSSFGVQGALANPRIQIYRGSELIAENDDWSAGANRAALAGASARVGAFALGAESRDAALMTTLAPGAYTAQVFDGGGSGVALAEIYDASTNPNADYQRLVNISTRGEAGTGENILIGGFIVTGNSPKKLLVRGIGPGLAAFGVSGALTDPRLRVYRDSTVLAENDNWSSGSAVDTATLIEAARVTGAFTLGNGSRDAALILTLAPGNYTAQVGSADNSSTGIALVEIYEIPE